MMYCSTLRRRNRRLKGNPTNAVTQMTSERVTITSKTCTTCLNGWRSRIWLLSSMMAPARFALISARAAASGSCETRLVRSRISLCRSAKTERFVLAIPWGLIGSGRWNAFSPACGESLAESSGGCRFLIFPPGDFPCLHHHLLSPQLPEMGPVRR
jgi:hypothetical protein